MNDDGRVISVLIVEDSATQAEMLRVTLEGHRFQVVAAADGRAGIAAARERRPDIVITDIVMPGMDGIELAKRAAEMNDALKIMFITGFAAVALHPSSNAPKQAKVLSKPFHLREIVAEVDRMLAAA